MSKICGKCNAENADEALFCNHCGNKFIQEQPLETKAQNTGRPPLERERPKAEGQPLERERSKMDEQPLERQRPQYQQQQEQQRQYRQYGQHQQYRQQYRQPGKQLEAPKKPDKSKRNRTIIIVCGSVLFVVLLILLIAQLTGSNNETGMQAALPTPTESAKQPGIISITEGSVKKTPEPGQTTEPTATPVPTQLAPPDKRYSMQTLTDAASKLEAARSFVRWDWTKEQSSVEWDTFYSIDSPAVIRDSWSSPAGDAYVGSISRVSYIYPLEGYGYVEGQIEPRSKTMMYKNMSAEDYAKSLISSLATGARNVSVTDTIPLSLDQKARLENQKSSIRAYLTPSYINGNSGFSEDISFDCAGVIFEYTQNGTDFTHRLDVMTVSNTITYNGGDASTKEVYWSVPFVFSYKTVRGMYDTYIEQYNMYCLNFSQSKQWTNAMSKSSLEVFKKVNDDQNASIDGMVESLKTAVRKNIDAGMDKYEQPFDAVQFMQYCWTDSLGVKTQNYNYPPGGTIRIDSKYMPGITNSGEITLTEELR